MVQLNFNANEVEPSKPRELLPAGEYLAIVEASEEKPTKDGSGAYLAFTFQILEGEHARRKLWANINHKNKSAEATKFGMAELSALCRAVGVMTPSSTEELHNRPLLITVGHEKRKDNGEMQNKVKGYKPAGMAGATAAPVAAKPAAGGPPPWAKK